MRLASMTSSGRVVVVIFALLFGINLHRPLSILSVYRKDGWFTDIINPSSSFFVYLFGKQAGTIGCRGICERK
jgi:hypothetical protein